MTVPTLTTTGAVLRPLELNDAEALFAAHGDERTHQYWSGPAHTNVEQTRAYIADTLALTGALVWAITEDGGEALGRIALFVQREGVGEIGIILAPNGKAAGWPPRVCSWCSSTASGRSICTASPPTSIRTIAPPSPSSSAPDFSAKEYCVEIGRRISAFATQ